MIEFAPFPEAAEAFGCTEVDVMSSMDWNGPFDVTGSYSRGVYAWELREPRLSMHRRLLPSVGTAPHG